MRGARRAKEKRARERERERARESERERERPRETERGKTSSRREISTRTKASTVVSLPSTMSVGSHMPCFPGGNLTASCWWRHENTLLRLSSCLIRLSDRSCDASSGAPISACADGHERALKRNENASSRERRRRRRMIERRAPHGCVRQ